jgi:pimeloyl-ACP methyl ester carboxylesterase
MVWGKEKELLKGYVEDLKKICDKKDFKNIVMVGLFMGGAIAQEFALTYP